MNNTSPGPLIRDRLTSLITDSLEFPLISVEAGSGYGETHVIDRYFQLADKDFSWLKMTRLDNIPEHFWKKYVQCISQKNKALTFQLLQLGFPYNPSEMERVLQLLATDIEKRQQYYMILDDFHRITDPDVLTFIDRLANTGWKNFSVIILSAPEPAMDLSSYRKKNMVSTITERDLIFTREEIVSYMESLSLHLSEAETDHIFAFTEGWALAVNLIATALRNGRSFEHYKSDLMTTVFDLMDKEVFSAYPLETQKALLQGSFFNYYPIDLITTITQFSKTQVLAFTRSNTFLRCDPASQTMSIHHLYLEFLKTKQYLISEKERYGLLILAAEWYLEHDYILDAVECWHQAGETDKVWQMIRKHAAHTLPARTADYYLHLLEQMAPDEESEYPDIYIYKAHLLLNNMQTEEALRLTRYLLNRFEPHKEEPRYQELLGEVYLLTGLICYHKKDTTFADYFEKAAAFLPEGSRIFDQAYPIIDINRAFACKSLQKQDVQEMADACLKGFSIFPKLTHGCGSGLGTLALAELSYYTGALDQAEALARRAIAESEEVRQTNILANGYFLLIRIEIARGNAELVLQYLGEMEEFRVETLTSRSAHSFLDIGLSWFYLKVGMTDKVAPWIISSQMTETLIPPMSAGSNHTVRAHWMLLNNTPPAEVITYLDKVIGVFLSEKRYLSLIHIYMLRGFASLAGEDVASFLKDYHASWQLVADSGLDMYFIELGEATCEALNFLKTIGNHGLPEAWMEEVLARSRDYADKLNTLIALYHKQT